MSDIFRKKSLDRVNSPEDLNQYMRVTNPSVWATLFCVILLLSSAVFWGLTAKLETTADAVAVRGENGNVCYIGADDIADVKIGTTVRIGKTEYSVTEIVHETLFSEDVLNDYEMTLAGFKNGETVYAAALDGDLLNTSSGAEVVLEEISPVSFLFGSGN